MNIRSAALPTFTVYFVLTILALLTIFPLLYTLLQAIMDPAQSSLYPPKLIPEQLYFGNILLVFKLIPVSTFISNSFIMATVIMIGQVCIASMAAYAFVYILFPGKQFWFILFLSTMMIPWEVTIIPNYLTIRSWDWLDSYQGLTLPFLASAFGVFLLRQFFLQLPRELFEAARIDGAGHIRHYLTIVLPLSRPALASLSVYVFLNSWNMYLWPLLVTNSDQMRTVQIGVSMLQFEEMSSWNHLLAGVLVVLIPSFILLIVGLKQLVRGITAGAVKG